MKILQCTMMIPLASRNTELFPLLTHWGRRSSTPSQRYGSDHISVTFIQIWQEGPVHCFTKTLKSFRLDAHFICDGRLFHNLAPLYRDDFKPNVVVSTDGWIIDLPPRKSYGVSDIVKKFSMNVGKLCVINLNVSVAIDFSRDTYSGRRFVVFKRSVYDNV